MHRMRLPCVPRFILRILISPFPRLKPTSLICPTVPQAAQATTSFIGAAICGVKMLQGYIKVLQLEKKEQQLAGSI